MIESAVVSISSTSVSFFSCIFTLFNSFCLSGVKNSIPDATDDGVPVMLPARDVEAPPCFFLVCWGLVVLPLCCFCFFDLALLVEGVADPAPLLPASAFALSLVVFFLFGMVLKRIGNDGRDGGTSADCSGTCRDDGWERIRFGGTGLDVGGEIDD